MPVPTSNQGAESKRWLVPLVARSRGQLLTQSLQALRWKRERTPTPTPARLPARMDRALSGRL